MPELYHATAASNARGIKRMGMIKPRGKSDGNWITEGKVKSHPEMVYLAHNYRSNDFHGLRTALVKGEKEYAVVVVDVDEKNLYPDENHLAKNFIIYAEEMRIARNQIKRNQGLWTDCLKQKGIVCHRGPVTKIKEIIYRPIEDSIWYFFTKDTDFGVESFDKRFGYWNQILQARVQIDPGDVDNRLIRFERTKDHVLLHTKYTTVTIHGENLC
jgi:hypothetical protein